mgnify:CR=1 FL=1
MQTLTGIDKSIPIHPNRKHIYNKFYKKEFKSKLAPLNLDNRTIDKIINILDEKNYLKMNEEYIIIKG